MSDVVIRAENLGKKYVIGHQAEDGRYVALRDVLMHNVRSMWHKTKDLVRGDAIVQGDSHEEVWALRDINFKIHQGDVVGIIGRNGSGKSTLLKILSRITEPTEGRVSIRGRVSSLLEVGTGFHPELTGRENIFLNGAILGMTRAEIKRKFDEIVAFAEIEKFLDTPVKRYSSGMYVRLAFAVAAHLEPEILLVDEVLAVGDAVFQKKCLGKMGDVAKEGRTVLFVSHNMTAVKSLCRRAIWLDEGQIIQSGETALVVNNYLQRGAFSIMERIWTDPVTAPGNERVKIRSARVRPLAAGADGELNVRSPFQIEFEFWNYQSDAILNLTMHLFNIEGAYIFASASQPRRRPRGLIREVVKIPANLLNDGVYVVSAQVVQDTSTTLYLLPEVLVFEVLDSIRQGAWFGKWPGVIRPELEWISGKVLEAESAQ